MPRPNRNRTLNVEASLARRIAYERDLRGWTNDGLAARMTDKGCAIHPSAIHKIVKSDPPRRITANELAGFAEVFGVRMEELITPPEILLLGRAKEAFAGWASAAAEIDSAQQKYRHAVAEVAQLLAEQPDVRDTLKEAMRAWLSDNYGSGYGYGYDKDEPVELMMRQFEEARHSERLDRDMVAAYHKEADQP